MSRNARIWAAAGAGVLVPAWILYMLGVPHWIGLGVLFFLAVGVTAVARRQVAPAPLACSFCRKSQREVQKLIAGPNVYICDECVRLCADILAETGQRGEAPSGDVWTPPKA